MTCRSTGDRTNKTPFIKRTTVDTTWHIALSQDKWGHQAVPKPISRPNYGGPWSQLYPLPDITCAQLLLPLPFPSVPRVQLTTTLLSLVYSPTWGSYVALPSQACIMCQTYPSLHTWIYFYCRECQNCRATHDMCPNRSWARELPMATFLHTPSKLCSIKREVSTQKSLAIRNGTRGIPCFASSNLAMDNRNGQQATSSSGCCCSA